MANLLQTGAIWLGAKLKGQAGTEVVYRRGAAVSITLTATVGINQFEAVDEQGVAFRVESRDYLIDEADLVDGGLVLPPRAGDRISETNGDNVRTYEVHPVANEPCWRYSDPFHAKLRIHTDQVKLRDA